MFEVRATPEALRHLHQLPPKVRDAALVALRGPISERPHQLGKPLVGDLAGLFSARRGDYRIIYEIDDRAKVVVVHRIQHRRTVYRRRWAARAARAARPGGARPRHGIQRVPCGTPTGAAGASPPGQGGTMQFRQIGDVQVSAVGLGEMPLSIEGRPDEDRAMRTVHAALDAGMTIVDTADAYCLDPGEHGHGERIVARALATYGGDTSGVLVATKGGHYRPGDGSWLVNGRPEYVKQACEASLKALGVEAIGLYQYHRPDPTVPWAESVGALAELLDEGKIRLAGVSNATVAQIDEAQQVLGGRLASVQNEFSFRFRSSEDELAHCEAIGVAFIPWSPLGGIGNVDRVAEEHPELAALAGEKGVTPQQLTLAWMIAKGDRVVPIPGSSRPETAEASAAAADIRLTPDEVARLDAA